MTPHAVVDAAGAGTRSRHGPREVAILFPAKGRGCSSTARPWWTTSGSTYPPVRLTGLLGAEGAGKSTILAAVCGLLPTDAGVVLLDGHRLDSLVPPMRTDLIGHTMREAVVLPTASVLNNLQRVVASGVPTALFCDSCFGVRNVRPTAFNCGVLHGGSLRV